MQLRVRLLPLEAEKPIVVLNNDDADEIDVKPLERVKIRYNRHNFVAIVNTTEKMVKQGEIGLYEDIVDELKIRSGQILKVDAADPPESLSYIKKKMEGMVLTKHEVDKIIDDTVGGNLSDIELTSFVTSLYNHGMTMGEIANLSMAMARTGDMLRIKNKEIYDKHSIGGVPGDKTSIIVVPTVAAGGLTIPKTSSRAITSPAGTADRFECIAPVELGLEEIKRVVEKTGACLVWGGAVDLAPADDMFIRIEYPLSIDPFLLPSVMSKKKAVGAKYLVIDIPTGDEAKINTKEDFENLADKFITLGKRLHIKVNAISTYADQPLGYAIGPALEAREALKTIMTGKGPADLVDKATTLAGVLFSFSGDNDGKKTAFGMLHSKKTYRKLQEIIEAQGGDPKIRPEDIPVGKNKAALLSKTKGKVLWISNKVVDMVARGAGAPKYKGAGILLNKKIGDKVKKGEKILEIYAENSTRLNQAMKIAGKSEIMKIGKESTMALDRFPSGGERERTFILER
ncbi:MAG: AMP phosphorylase [Candidatus Aenigmarchaeota archaeon]|nr:AMP phosphorylase [Candidatus Aenigmarchaeota archaeon]